MLETSLKGIHRLDGREKLIAQNVPEQKMEGQMACQDMDMMRQFGKFNAHYPLSSQANVLAKITGGFGGSCELSYILLSPFYPLYILILTLVLLLPLGSLVGTPYYFEPVDFCDPFRLDVPHELLIEIYKRDLFLRCNLRGNIEKIILGTRGTPEAYRWLSQLLWDHLYPIPAGILN